MKKSIILFILVVVGVSVVVTGCHETCNCTRTIIKEKECEPCPEIDYVQECINTIKDLRKLEGEMNNENISQ